MRLRTEQTSSLETKSVSIQPPDAQVISAHIANTQSTHGTAAQASAARLIVQLRQDFPQSVTDLSEATKDRPACQAGIRLFQRYILDPKHDFEAEERCLVNEHLKTILEHGGRDHWTTNRYYNAATGTVETVDASLREVLNLVCLATFQIEFYPEGQRSSTDTDARVLSLFKCLLDLKRHQDMCLGGQQHELLFLLNGCYRNMHLIEDIDAFLLDTTKMHLADAVIKHPESFQLTLAWLRNVNEEADQPKVLEWLSEQANNVLRVKLLASCAEFGLNPADESIIKKIDVTLANIANFELPNGIYPADSRVVPLIAGLLRAKPLVIQNQTQTFFIARNAALELAKESLKNCRSFADISTQLKDFASAEAILGRMIKYKKLSVIIGREEGTLQSCLTQLCVVMYKYYRKVTLGNFGFSNKESLVRFQALQQTFLEADIAFSNNNHIEFITNFFAHLNNNRQFIASLNRLHIIHKHKSLALTDADIQRIMIPGNNHAGMKETGNVSDPSAPAAAQAVVELRPYEINRVLLNTYLVPLGAWSEPFCAALSRIVAWLLDGENHRAELLMTSVQAVYPKQYLLDLQFLILIAKSNLSIEFKNKISLEYQSIIPIIHGHNLIFRFFSNCYEIERGRRLIAILGSELFSQWILTVKDLAELFISVPWSEANLSQIVTAVQGRLSDPSFIRNADDLRILLNQSKLSSELLGQVLEAAQSRLSDPIFIPNSSILLTLCNCFTFFIKHSEILNLCEKILSAVQDRFTDHGFILHFNDLVSLLRYSKHNAINRAKIFTVLQSWLMDPGCILDFQNLKLLLNLNFPDEMMDQFWTAIQGRLRAKGLINNVKDLVEILAYYNSYNWDSQRYSEHLNKIFNSMQGRWSEPGFIQNDSELQILITRYKISHEQKNRIISEVQEMLSSPGFIRNAKSLQALISSPLNTELVDKIWITVQNQFSQPDFIKDTHDLQIVLNCSNLRTEHIDYILTVVQNRWVDPHFIRSARRLRGLLDNCNLNANQIDHILSNVQTRLTGPKFIRDIDKLKTLLNCKELNAEQKTKILHAVQDRLLTPGFIKHAHDLQGLLNCCDAHHSAQIHEIWAVMQGRLSHPGFIRDANDLKILLNCSRLDSEHLTQIWTAVQGHLSTPGFIRNSYDLLKLLKSSRLNSVQKSQIWTAARGNLSDSDFILCTAELQALENPSRCIKKRRNLYGLWDVSARQLAKERDKLEVFRKDSNLKELLLCSKLNIAQKYELLTSLSNNLLLNFLSDPELGDPERGFEPRINQMIWTTIQSRLSTPGFIQNVKNIAILLECPILSFEQLDHILLAVQDLLLNPYLIQNSGDLMELLDYSDLSSDQQAQIWTAVQDRFFVPYFIQSLEDLQKLLSCHNLNYEYKAKIVIAALISMQGYVPVIYFIQNNEDTLCNQALSLLNVIYPDSSADKGLICAAVQGILFSSKQPSQLMSSQAGMFSGKRARSRDDGENVPVKLRNENTFGSSAHL